MSIAKFSEFSSMTLAHMTVPWEERPPDEEQNISRKNASRKHVPKDTVWLYLSMKQAVSNTNCLWGTGWIHFSPKYLPHCRGKYDHSRRTTKIPFNTRRKHVTMQNSVLGVRSLGSAGQFFHGISLSNSGLTKVITNTTPSKTK